MASRSSPDRTAAVRASTEELLTKLISSANHLVWCTSLDGMQLLYANPVAARIYGRPLDELVANQDYWLDAIHPDDRGSVLKNLSELQRLAPIEQEYRIVRPNGTVIWLHDRISVVHDEHGAPMCVGGIGTDISAMRESEARYSSLVESLPLHVIRKDLDGKVVFGNQRYCQAIGLPLEELIGKTDFDLFPPDLAQKYVDDDKRVLKTGKVVNDIEAHVNSDGTRVYVEIFKSPVHDAQGKPNGVQVMFWDVTQRKQAEEEVRIAKELAEKANRAKSEFLANMSHEIRTPMNGIIGMTALLLGTTPTAEQRHYLNMVKQSADSLLRLLNDILDFSKIEAGKLDLENSEFSLRDCVEQTGQSLGGRAGEKGLELLCHVASDLPDALIGDAGRLGQIVTNLVGNAIKFTEQGEVEVDVSCESRSDDSICLHFSVRDTGIGIPPAQQQRIFESFSQVDSSTTRRFGGTGLGLAISSQLVHLMNGRIWIESEIDRGTTFHFTACFEVHDQESLADELEQVRGMPILAVDDNCASRRILDELLRSWGLAPTVVESGPLAIDEIKRATMAGQPYGIAILDRLMPGMDGFNVATRIHEDDELHDCRMIMLSSAATAEDLKRCRRLGIARYIQKPVIQTELLDTILQLTGVRQTESASSNESTEQPARTKLKILLAEDGEVNQQVAIGLLKQHGHDVVVAHDGHEAIIALQEQPFDLVLMDVQMPNMDGHKATKIIRQNEQASGRHTPIVAMTAGAMKGDKEKCLESGMDGYVSKPIDPQLLFDAIDQCVGFSSASDLRARQDNSNAMSDRGPTSGAGVGERSVVDETIVYDPGVINIDAARTLCSDDDERMRELASTLLDESASLMKEIRDAVESLDAGSLRGCAHSLKGAASVFGATKVVETALHLEMIGADGDLNCVNGALSELENEMSRLTQVLKMISHSSTTCTTVPRQPPRAGQANCRDC